MKWSAALAAIGLVVVSVLGCERGKPRPKQPDGRQHVHADGSVHDGHEHSGGQGHSHEHSKSIALGEFDIGGVRVQAAQEQSKVSAGGECQLVIKLPYCDKGETTIRAWIGTEDRTLSMVGKGVYAPGHDDYDIHTVAPQPIPDGAQWWVEIEKPDGTKTLGAFPFAAD